MPMLYSPYFRKIIFHKDICSSNIVLDKYLNARLIDFGLAREEDDHTTTHSEKLPYAHPDIEQNKCASVTWDYYSFGVVIRELLTDLPPSSAEGGFLKTLKTTEDIIARKSEVWQEDDEFLLRAIDSIALNCLNSQEGKFDIQRDVIDKVTTVFQEDVMVVDSTQEVKCMSCMINPACSEAPKHMYERHTLNCKHMHSISLCVACERNSFLNPVSCYGCGMQLYPLIGHEWGALLLAGNDLEDDVYAQVLKDDVERVKKVFVSRVPVIVGISEENVRSITLSKPGKLGTNEKLLPQLKTAVKEINKTNVHTLVVYFSCHGGNDGENYFQLASVDEKLTVTKLQELFMLLTKVKKVIVFFDRCYAPKLVLEGKIVVQINACKENKEAPILKDGSPFTQYLIKGLKAKSEGGRCDQENDRCKICEDYWATRQDYVTVECLLHFVAEHMKSKGYPEPYNMFEGEVDDLKLAYYSDEEVLIDFTEDGQEGKPIQQIAIGLCQSMDQLQSQLLLSFNKESDMAVVIQSVTYQKKQRFEDCKDIAEVMMAWVMRKPLHVKFTKRIVSS